MVTLSLVSAQWPKILNRNWDRAQKLAQILPGSHTWLYSQWIHIVCGLIQKCEQSQKMPKLLLSLEPSFHQFSWRDTELHKSNCFYIPMETYFILIFFSAKDCHFFYSGNKHFIIKVWILILITLKMRSRLGQYVVTGTTLGSPDTSSTGSVDLLVLWDGIWSWMSLLDTLLRSSVKLSCLNP